MSLPKGSENPPKKSKWIKKGWVVKKVTNPVGCCCATGTQPAAKCPYREFYPCYADAYGSYRCPRCGKSFRLSVPTRDENDECTRFRQNLPEMQLLPLLLRHHDRLL